MGDKQIIATHSPPSGEQDSPSSLWSRSRFSSFSRCRRRRAPIPRRNPTYGRIKISTNPGGYPVLIDGQPAGSTTASERLLDLPAGPHTVEIIFPNGERWMREFVD